MQHSAKPLKISVAMARYMDALFGCCGSGGGGVSSCEVVGCATCATLAVVMISKPRDKKICDAVCIHIIYVYVHVPGRFVDIHVWAPNKSWMLNVYTSDLRLLENATIVYVDMLFLFSFPFFFSSSSFLFLKINNFILTLIPQKVI